MNTEFLDIPEDDDTPDVIDELMEVMRLERDQKIAKLGAIVADKRDSAVKARQQSGIERIWSEDEEYYLGIDDANRDSYSYLKPPSMSGGLSSARRKDPSRSTAFFNITGQFCDSASARMGDILLPAGDWNFAVKPTPKADQSLPVKEGEQNQGNQAQAQPQMMAMQQQPSQPPSPLVPSPAPGVPPSPVMPSGPSALEVASRVERAETQIRDWLTECQYHSEVRKALEDCVRIGTGILKGPVPKKMKSQVIKHGEDGKITVEYEEKTAPASYRVSPWDFFPDPACGQNIHDGAYCLERDMMTAKQLRDLKGLPGYIGKNIDLVLDEGPGRKNYVGGIRAVQSEQDNESYEVWYYHGDVALDALSAMGVKSESDSVNSEDSGPHVPAVVVLVNNTAIKAFLSPLDSGEFPYDVIPWQQMQGVPWGVGVSRKGRVAQDMLNAAGRAMMDNAGLSSGPQLIIRESAIRPADGNWMLTPRKVWISTDASDVRSASDAIMAINIPMMQGELGAIIQLAYKMMEDATGIFFIMQGQQGSAPDTVGGMELLHKNATATLRRLARVFDERITEPHIRRYYAWLLQYGPDDCKGELQIEAIGSTAMVEREIQMMELTQLLQASLNPIFGLDPEKTMAEVLKAKRFIPEKLIMDPAKRQQLMSQPQVVPAIEAAKIKADVELRKEKIRAQASLHRAQVDMDRDRAYTEAMTRRDETNALSRREELKIKRENAMLQREIAMADYATKRSISLEKAKKDLATTAMQLRVQKEIAAETNRATQVAKSGVEVPGKAPNGEAFQR